MADFCKQNCLAKFLTDPITALEHKHVFDCVSKLFALWIFMLRNFERVSWVAVQIVTLLAHIVHMHEHYKL